MTAGATNNSKDGTKPADGTTVEQPFPENVVFWRNIIHPKDYKIPYSCLGNCR